MECPNTKSLIRLPRSVEACAHFLFTIKGVRSFFVYFSLTAGLEAQRFLVANSQAALQTMMNQQNAALRTAAPLGGAPLIISPRLQVPTSLASGLLNGTGGQNPAGPPPLIAAGDTSGLLYAQYAAAASAADYANYSGLVNPLLAAEYSTADPSGGLFAR